MVANFNPDRTAEIIKALATIPQDWSLTPVWEKRPTESEWEKQGLDRKIIERKLKSRKATGFGLLLGEKSGGLLAVDVDGPAAQEWLNQYGELPQTVRYTSGLKCRYQALFQVPEHLWSIVKSVDHNTHIKDERGKEQQLEFRWTGRQSVLPPSLHPDTPGYKWVEGCEPNSVEIAECPVWLIELNMGLQDKAKTEQEQKPSLPLSYTTQTHPKDNPLDKISLPFPASIPLNWCLGESKENLNGVCEGSRNNSAFELACDAIGCTNELQRIGQNFEGDAYQLLQDFALGCNPPIPSKEIDSIWKSAQKKNPSPSINQKSPDAFAKRLKSWFYQNHVKNNRTASSSKVATTPQAVSNVVPLFPETLDLGGDIDKLIEANLRKSELTIEIAKLSEWHRQTHSVIYKIYQEREEELQQQNNQDSIASELAQLLASKSVKINLLEILPQGLAEGITRIAETLNLKPECYVLALLTQVSALLKPGTSTMLYPQTSFKVCPNYFGATIGESSQKKTPIKVAVISEPMEQLIDASVQAFESAKVGYEEELNLWKKNDKADKGLMPKPPAQRIYHITTATGESIPKQAARMPDQSILWVADELAGTFKSANQYRDGKGSDEENLLEYWSGGGAAVLRAEGLAVNARNIGLSIFGNIQPKVLAQFLKDGEDDNGKFARFDFVQQPLAATELLEDAPNVNISPMLADLYKRLDPLPAQKFKLDKEARKAFIAYYNQCESERVSHPKQGMRAMLGKAPEKVGKVATILHCIDSAFRCVEVSENIPVEFVQAAIKWVSYTTSQALSVNLEICDSTALAPNLDKIITLARKKGGVVSARDAQNSFNHKLKITSQQVKEWFAQLESLKYGKVTTANKSVLFTLVDENKPTVVTVDNRSHTVVKDKLQSEPLLDKGLTPTVVTVVSVLPPSENSDIKKLDLQSKPLTTQTVTTVGSNVAPVSIDVDYSPFCVLTTVTTAATTALEPELNEHESELLAMIQETVAEADPEVARETAADILPILKDVCTNGGANREKVWVALTDSERSRFSELSSQPIAQADNSTEPEQPLTEIQQLVIEAERMGEEENRLHKALAILLNAKTWAEISTLFQRCDAQFLANLKASLGPEDYVRYRRLQEQAMCASQAKVEYVGIEFREQLAGLELSVIEWNFKNMEIVCETPNRKRTPRLKMSDLNMLWEVQQ